MSQFRQNPLTGQWVSIAPQRADRPVDVQHNLGEEAEPTCPFCEGNEESTPAESLVLRGGESLSNGPGWKVRVVPNRYPFVEAVTDTAGTTPPDEFFTAHSSEGVQEVIIESPRHATEVTQLSTAEWTDVLGVYRTRLKQLHNDGRWKYVLLFKNSGEAAGASLSHIHSQLVALPTTPDIIDAMSKRFQQHFQRHGRSLLTDLVNREIVEGARVVDEGEHFVALCPFASRQPYEIHVIPKRQAASFAEVADTALP